MASVTTIDTPIAPAAWDWARSALLVAGGLCIAVPFLDSRAWPLAWIGLMPLIWLAPHAKSPRAALIAGLTMGLATNVPAFAWLVRTINVFGGFPFPLAALFYLLLSLYGAFQFSLFAIGLQRAGAHAPVILAPLLWTAIEFLYPNLFPWRLGQSQRDLPVLLQTGDLGGPFLLTFLMVWIGATLVRAPRRASALVAPVAAILLALAYGAWRVATISSELARASDLRVGIVQGNISLTEKRHREHFESNVARYQRLSSTLEPAPDLLVWPETVVEWGIPREAMSLGDLDPLPGSSTPLVFGALSYDGKDGELRWFNSAFLRRSDGTLGGSYDKIVLMPFGEFIPFASLFPSIKQLSPNTSDLTAGTEPGVLDAGNGVKVGPLICYEDLLAGHVRESVVKGASILVTLANDAWFDDSAALRQHETLALWRAIENRRYFVRATNTGLTSVVNPLGEVVLSLPSQAPVAASVEARTLTIVSPYQRIGDAIPWTIVVAASLLLLRRRPPPVARLQ